MVFLEILPSAYMVDFPRVGHICINNVLVGLLLLKTWFNNGLNYKIQHNMSVLLQTSEYFANSSSIR